MSKCPLLFGNVVAGSVKVVREGRFCRITCICDMQCAVDNYIFVYSGDKRICLGKCTQESGSYTLRRFLNIHNFEEEELIFRIEDQRVDTSQLIPIDPSQPFQAIAELPHARFTQKGIILDK